MTASRVLVLGGTTEGRELASALVARGVAVTSSLAGRTEAPAAVAGDVRVGGFGGAAGLADWLRASGVVCVVDATHPFSVRISASAAEACASVGVPLLRLSRPGFGGDFARVASLEEAAARVDGLGTRVLLTTGRQGVGAFSSVRAWTLVRCVSAPSEPLPARSEVLLARGPFSVDAEVALLRAHRIDLLVTKDSGGSSAKLEAAAALGVPVLVVARPGSEAGASVPDVAAAVAWVMMRA